ncbi:MAG: hypothetical protein QXQ02_05315 [Halobacteria archaeon]
MKIEDKNNRPKARNDIGAIIAFDLLKIETPITKEKLLEEYGQEIVGFIWENDKQFSLQELLQYTTVNVFHSKLELADELTKAYRRYKANF